MLDPYEFGTQNIETLDICEECGGYVSESITQERESPYLDWCECERDN